MYIYFCKIITTFSFSFIEHKEPTSSPKLVCLSELKGFLVCGDPTLDQRFHELHWYPTVLTYPVLKYCIQSLHSIHRDQGSLVGITTSAEFDPRFESSIPADLALLVCTRNENSLGACNGLTIQLMRCLYTDMKGRIRSSTKSNLRSISVRWYKPCCPVTISNKILILKSFHFPCHVNLSRLFSHSWAELRILAANAL